MQSRKLREAAPLRIAIISTQRGWHGGEEQARLLAEGLRQRGHQCHVLARRNAPFAQRLRDAGFDVVEFPSPWAASLVAMREALRGWGPDVMHFNDGHAVMRGGLASLGLRGPVRIAARRVDFRLRSSMTYRMLCDRLVCVSQAVAGVCRDAGLPDEMLRVVHDGVDSRRVEGGRREPGREALGLSSEDVLLLCVAKLTDHKGHRFLLDAMPRIVEAHPQVRLAFAGDGELSDALREQANGLGISDRVRFLGFRDDVPNLLHAADVFVHPSHMEGLCTSIIDAMLASRAIVTTTAGGIVDLVPRVDAGELPVAWLTPPRDPVALADAILEALADPNERAARGSRARRRANQRFLSDHMVDSTLEVYHETLESRRPASGERIRRAG